MIKACVANQCPVDDIREIRSTFGNKLFQFLIEKADEQARDTTLAHGNVLEQYKTTFQPFLQECDIIDKYGDLFQREYYHFVSLHRFPSFNQNEANSKQNASKNYRKNFLYGMDDDEIDLNEQPDQNEAENHNQTVF